MSYFRNFIDFRLNYGRQHIESFLTEIKSFDSVLDLGAGQGDDLAIARKVNPNAKLFAIESYSPNIEILESQHVQVYSLDIERARLPFEDNSLDVVVMNQIIEHVKDIFWILHEVTRVIKPGGHLIIGVPNLAAWHNRISLLIGNQPTCLKNDSAHVRGFTKRDLIQFMNCGYSGYSVVSFKGSNFYPFPAFLAKPLAKLFPTFSTCLFLKFQKTTVYDKKGYLNFPLEHVLETNFFLG